MTGEFKDNRTPVAWTEGFLNTYFQGNFPFKVFEMLYINSATRSLGLTVGQPCYKMAYGTDVPCDICPIRQLSDTVHVASKDVYSNRLNGWINAAASKLRWEGDREAILIYCTDISKYVK